jgi:hypothetical protein
VFAAATGRATPAGRRFEQVFSARFGIPPDTYVAWIYDSIYLLAGILREHGAEPQAISAALRTARHTGVQGVYQFDAQGEGLHQVTLVQMAAGQPQLVGSYSMAGFAPRPATPLPSAEAGP